MSNEIQIFESEQFEKIRVLEIDGEPWFVAKDVAIALEHANPERAIRLHVNQKDRSVTETVTEAGRRNVTIINESGLYALIFSSRTEKARAFTSWVTSEVLPTIRRHGAYMTKDTLEKALLDPHYLKQLAERLIEEQERADRAEAMVEEQKKEIAELAPKANYCDVVLDAENVVSIIEPPTTKVAGFLLH